MIRTKLFLKGSENCRKQYEKASMGTFCLLISTIIFAVFISTTITIALGVLTILYGQLTLYYSRRYIEEKKEEEKC